MPDVFPLQLLHAGATAQVVDVIGCPEQIQRVRELGFQDGVRIDVVQSGKPCIIKLGAQTLCVRGTELLNVLVRLG